MGILRLAAYTVAIASAGLVLYVAADSKRREEFLRRCEEWARGLPLKPGEWQEYTGVKKLSGNEA